MNKIGITIQNFDNNVKCVHFIYINYPQKQQYSGGWKNNVLI